jgi:hypothetical protein
MICGSRGWSATTTRDRLPSSLLRNGWHLAVRVERKTVRSFLFQLCSTLAVLPATVRFKYSKFKRKYVLKCSLDHTTHWLSGPGTSYKKSNIHSGSIVSWESSIWKAFSPLRVKWEMIMLLEQNKFKRRYAMLINCAERRKGSKFEVTLHQVA